MRPLTISLGEGGNTLGTMNSWLLGSTLARRFSVGNGPHPCLAVRGAGAGSPWPSLVLSLMKKEWPESLALAPRPPAISIELFYLLALAMKSREKNH